MLETDAETIDYWFNIFIAASWLISCVTWPLFCLPMENPSLMPVSLLYSGGASCTAGRSPNRDHCCASQCVFVSSQLLGGTRETAAAPAVVIKPYVLNRKCWRRRGKRHLFIPQRWSWQTDWTRVYLFSGRHGNMITRWTHWFSECNNAIKVAVSVWELVNSMEENRADASKHHN